MGSGKDLSVLRPCDEREAKLHQRGGGRCREWVQRPQGTTEEQQGASVAGSLEVGGSLKSSLGGRVKAALGFCSRREWRPLEEGQAGRKRDLSYIFESSLWVHAGE